MKNFYQTLGLKNCVPMPEVKKAYRTLALCHHPDRGGDQEKMKEINEAYEYLNKHKENYDRQLTSSPVRPGGVTIIVGGWSYYGSFDMASTSTTSGATW